MDISHLTSQSLRRILALTEKKNTLLKGLEDIETEIARTLTGATSTVQGMGRSVAVFGSVSNGSSRRPGSLKERILNLLEAAGKEGMKVKEIASRLGVPTGNISVWFSTTGKQLTTKVEPGRYAVKPSGAKSNTKGTAKKKAAQKVKIEAGTKSGAKKKPASKAAPKKSGPKKSKPASKKSVPKSQPKTEKPEGEKAPAQETEAPF